MAANPNTLYLISKLVIDSMENDINAALYYEAEGYVESEEDAKKLVAQAGNINSDSWPIMGHPKPKRIYITINRLDLATS